MDNVTPLQQLASIGGSAAPTNMQGALRSPYDPREPVGVMAREMLPRTVAYPVGPHGPADNPERVAISPDASEVMRRRAMLEARAQAAQTAQGVGASLAPVHLFQPRDTIRYRTSASAGGNGDPEYLAPGAQIDVWFAAAPAADTKLEILDAKGTVIRSFGVGPERAGGRAQEMRGPFGRGGGPSSLRGETGMQRFTWDMRYPGVGGGGNGPMAPPGKYSVRLTSGAYNATRSFELKADPRVLKDGVTQADLDEQFAFQVKVRDAQNQARDLQQRINEAMKKAGVPQPGAATPGVRAMDEKFAHPLQKLLGAAERSARHLSAADADQSAAERAAYGRAGGSEGRQGRDRSLQRSDEGAAGPSDRVPEGQRLHVIQRGGLVLTGSPPVFSRV